MFANRSAAVEIMDDLNCHGEVVDQTLRELEFINKWLGGNAVTLDAVDQLTKKIGNRTISIADLGCGSGDMLRLLSKWASKKQIKVQLTGIDANPHIIDFAQRRCADHPEITFEAVDIFAPEFKTRTFDIVVGTLFYHHFDSQKLTDFFSDLKQQTRIGIVINDIHRHWLAYYSIKFLTAIFSRSAMVKFDAPLSVLRAFKKKELENILEKSGMSEHTLNWKWAFRWQVIWRKSQR
jgi:2-polyprenyl-3-methyl-5-hydroxy-6-metoxy-1,4-benzoquinol methylase